MAFCTILGRRRCVVFATALDNRGSDGEVCFSFFLLLVVLWTGRGRTPFGALTMRVDLLSTYLQCDSAEAGVQARKAAPACYW